MNAQPQFKYNVENVFILTQFVTIYIYFYTTNNSKELLSNTLLLGYNPLKIITKFVL